MLEGEIEGYRLRVSELKQIDDSIVVKMKKLKAVMRKQKGAEEELKRKLQDMDSNDEVSVSTWSIESSWKFFQAQKAGWAIHRHQAWRNQQCKCEFVTKHADEHCRYGIVKGKFMRGLYAQMEAYSTKKIRFEDEIVECKRIKANLKEEADRSKVKLQNLKTKIDKNVKEMNEFEAYIDQKNEELVRLASETMTMEEVNEYLKQ